MKREDTYYKAMLARDHRFDGKFFIGVKTTGIYCRPICPARPLRQNVVFYPSYLEAERAGFRPCLRCRPESAPRSPAWIGTSAVVQRALKMIHHQNAVELDENRFADLFGISARHLRRLFIEEIGKTPKQLSFENRLNLSRQLVVETSLPITEVVSAAGFNSVRRFNDAFKKRFKKSPSDIRRKKTDHKSLRVSLSYRPPYDFEGLVASYRSHKIGDLEWFSLTDDGKTQMNRVVEIDGKVGTIAITNDAKICALRVEIDFPDTSAIGSIIARVRAMFDLDSDPIIIANSIEQTSALKKILKKHEGLRLPSGWDPFEIGIGTILGQFVTIEFGGALMEDLIELLGRPSGLSRNGKSIKLFPQPAAIANSDLVGVRTTNSRKQTLRLFSKAVADGRLSLEPTQDVDEFKKNLLAIKGIGPWTATYMSLKVLRDTDAFPSTDLILARALEFHPAPVIDKISPWRGYAAALLWREYTQTLKKRGNRK